MPKLVNLGSLCVDNVYRVGSIAAAGAQVVHVGCVGGDGDWLRDTLAAEGVDVSGVRIVDGSSGHAVIQVNDRGENAIVIAGGANRTLDNADVERALDQVRADDWLLLQNEINDLEEVLRLARERRCRLAFNVAPVDGREAGYDLADVHLLIVNEIEAAALAGTTDPPTAAKLLRDRLPNAEVVLTLGKDGLIHAGANGLSRLAAYPVQAMDETAAGDAFIGFLMAALLAGDNIEPALRMGSAAGALAATKAGAASSIPTLTEVRKLAAG